MRMIFFPAVTLVLLATSAFATTTESLQLTGNTMGTYYSIVVDSPPQSLGDGTALKAKIESTLKEVNRQMSTWDETSEISRFNCSTSTDWVDVSGEFAVVVAEARKIHELSDGAFDPTLAPLISLWGFGDRRDKQIPNQAAIEEAKQSTGMKHLEVRLIPPALKKAIPTLQINLSAIAKGYGVDAVGNLLEAENLTSYVVDIGGENRTGVAKSSGGAWKLGIESPTGGLKRILQLTQTSVATSGDYRNFFEMDGVTYSHAIDPTTGWPVKNPPASVTVTHKSCMTADAWATTMMILGTERGVEVASKNGLPVLFQLMQSDGSVAEISNDGFKALPQTEVAESEPDVTNNSPASNVADKKQNTAKWFPFAAAAVLFVLAIGGMAIGTMLQNKSIKGSCGGLASMPGSDGKSICELCTIPKDQCTNAELKEQMQAAAAKREASGQQA